MQASDTKDLELLLAALRGAGTVAMDMRAKPIASRNKPDGTLVTEADLAVDAFLKAMICTARPDDGWLSEETPDNAERLARKRVWVVDPIDGTRAYADQTEFWGIGVALVEDGLPLMGGIYCPAVDVMYHAIKNGSAFRNAVPLTSPESGGAVIVPRKAVAPVEALGLATQVSSKWPMLVRFALIAEGQNPAAISIGAKQDWDLAAGILLVTETGGKVSTQNGGTMQFNRPQHQQAGLVAAQRKWHDTLVEAVRDL